jgi:hypothetical protein
MNWLLLDTLAKEQVQELGNRIRTLRGAMLILVDDDEHVATAPWGRSDNDSRIMNNLRDEIIAEVGLSQILEKKQKGPMLITAFEDLDDEEDIMGEVAWSFTDDPFLDLDTFSNEVKNYHSYVFDGNTERWDPEEVVLEAPIVAIVFSYLDQEDNTILVTFRLKARNGKNFTAVDLLFQVHNKTVARLRETKYKYFEGFEFIEKEENSVPCYEILLGS